MERVNGGGNCMKRCPDRERPSRVRSTAERVSPEESGGPTAWRLEAGGQRMEAERRERWIGKK